VRLKRENKSKKPSNQPQKLLLDRRTGARTGVCCCGRFTRALRTDEDKWKRVTVAQFVFDLNSHQLLNGAEGSSEAKKNINRMCFEGDGTRLSNGRRRRIRKTLTTGEVQRAASRRVRWGPIAFWVRHL